MNKKIQKDLTSPVKRGDRLAIPAQTFNKMLEVTKDFQRKRFSEGTYTPSDTVNPNTTVTIRNGTASEVPLFGVLKITGSLFPFVDDPLNVVTARPAVEGYTPDAEDNAVAILQEPLDTDELGTAVIAGVTVGYVLMNNPAHEWAVPINGETAYLESAETGSIRILDREEIPDSPYPEGVEIAVLHVIGQVGGTEGPPGPPGAGWLARLTDSQLIGAGPKRLYKYVRVRLTADGSNYEDVGSESLDFTAALITSYGVNPHANVPYTLAVPHTPGAPHVNIVGFTPGTIVRMWESEQEGFQDFITLAPLAIYVNQTGNGGVYSGLVPSSGNGSHTYEALAIVPPGTGSYLVSVSISDTFLQFTDTTASVARINLIVSDNVNNLYVYNFKLYEIQLMPGGGTQKIWTPFSATFPVYLATGSEVRVRIGILWTGVTAGASIQSRADSIFVTLMPIGGFTR